MNFLQRQSNVPCFIALTSCKETWRSEKIVRKGFFIYVSWLQVQNTHQSQSPPQEGKCLLSPVFQCIYVYKCTNLWFHGYLLDKRWCVHWTPTSLFLPKSFIEFLNLQEKCSISELNIQSWNFNFRTENFIQPNLVKDKWHYNIQRKKFAIQAKPNISLRSAS